MNFAEKIQDLFNRYGSLPGITIECQKELIAISVINKAAKAEVFLQGAQITRYQRHHQPPHLFLSEACLYKQGLPLRGGIPICWPWFGDLHRNPDALQQQFSSEQLVSAPAHGFIRERDWQLNDIRIISDECTALEFTYSIEQGAEILWPFKTLLTYTMEIGKTLNVNLVVENKDQKNMTFSSALHTYLQVGHIQDSSIKGLNGVSYIDALNKWQQSIQESTLEFNAEIDRIYQMPHASQKTELPCILLIDKARKIKVTSKGSASTVIWNPWIEKSKQLSQFREDDYLKMICIETANVLDDCKTLSPGKSHSLNLILE